VSASAKVVSRGGEAAVDASGSAACGWRGRSGDLVETGSGAQAVLASDDTRITLGHHAPESTASSMTIGTRAKTLPRVAAQGFRARSPIDRSANNRNVGFSAATATIGIRGTGLTSNARRLRQRRSRFQPGLTVYGGWLGAGDASLLPPVVIQAGRAWSSRRRVSNGSRVRRISTGLPTC
jgi:hypothetical protein